MIYVKEYFQKIILKDINLYKEKEVKNKNQNLLDNLKINHYPFKNPNNLKEIIQQKEKLKKLKLYIPKVKS